MIGGRCLIIFGYRSVSVVFHESRMFLKSNKQVCASSCGERKTGSRDPDFMFGAVGVDCAVRNDNNNT